ncbi:MAG TPA: thioredoxin domain-containing protein [Gemmatimonadaceae bacterium]|nr:thioredoxin domain-containing protein [Gemmatimonadaceae bacterium]
MPNRLSAESSPYLRQHAANPVDWWPWCADALAEARRTDRPILLSIGYAACHWCHVMAHESFEDAGTAALMNAHFVNVKVDREERPDLDGIYMQAVQAMTGQGGWPMTVFLTPEGVPFFGGTYFPPADRHGLPAFRRVLASVADAWRGRRDGVLESAAAVRRMYDGMAAGAGTATPTGTPGHAVTPATLATAFDGIRRMREPRFEGLGGAPKFPHAMALDFCLRHWARTGDALALDIAHKTFLAMARGGIFDQVGGGFHRYSTDARWLVPHFEKMLYDNALLARLGVHLWQATGDAEVRRATEATLAWACREMRTAGGGFCSSLDADSEGEEGRFYVWTAGELRAALGADYDVCAAAWGVTDAGNFEGRNILHRSGEAHDDMRDTVRERATRTLYDLRERRARPGRDDKVITSWNALMVRALAEAGRVFGDDRWRTAALDAAGFIERELVRGERVMRSWLGAASHVGGFLEDHAALGLAHVALYQATFDRRWLDRARTLGDACVEWFWDDATGGFFDTARDQEALITRPRDIADNATPAGTSLAAELLLMLAEYFGDADARRRADAVLAPSREAMERMPVMLGHLLGAADMAVCGAVEVAVSGDPDSAAGRALLSVVAGAYVPSLVLAAGAGAAVSGLPLFEGRASVAGPTAYVCRGYTCAQPATDAAALREQLTGATRVG